MRLCVCVCVRVCMRVCAHARVENDNACNALIEHFRFRTPKYAETGGQCGEYSPAQPVNQQDDFKY